MDVHRPIFSCIPATVTFFLLIIKIGYRTGQGLSIGGSNPPGAGYPPSSTTIVGFDEKHAIFRSADGGTVNMSAICPSQINRNVGQPVTSGIVGEPSVGVLIFSPDC
jgi:hypothetical protein